MVFFLPDGYLVLNPMKNPSSSTPPMGRVEIRNLLKEFGFRPSKRYGQNFLLDPNLHRCLVEWSEASSDHLLFEVGCGMGHLTCRLAEVGGHLIVSEIDDRLAELTRRYVPESERVRYVIGDCLSSKHQIAFGLEKALRESPVVGPSRLVANLPYAIAGPLLVLLLHGDFGFDRAVVTLQKEMAERIAASPGSRTYGGLSAIIQSVAVPRILTHVDRRAFWPVPRVDSSVLQLEVRQPGPFSVPYEPLSRVVKSLFSHRRKVLVRAIRFELLPDASREEAEKWLKCLGIDPLVRPECLSPQDFMGITRALLVP